MITTTANKLYCQIVFVMDYYVVCMHIVKHVSFYKNKNKNSNHHVQLWARNDTRNAGQ